MEKRWGLDLDMSAVRLMRRDDNAWVEVAIEKIDGPDIEDRLVAMIGQIDEGAPVVLFLPRDQILYTQVELGPVGDARAQIERAMDGRTPYDLDELSLDWELTSSGSARVAAIAFETLDEAAAFAEVRGLDISGYSSLVSGEDFPRPPVFDGPNIIAPVIEEETEQSTPEPEAVQFVSARKPSRPPAEAANPLALDNPVMPETAPVIHVDDARPVMEVKSPVQPLDPGAPITAPATTPRIRTDIAASTVSGSAASLTPPGGSVKVRKNGSIANTAMIFAAVFVVTIGIATLVWTLLPLSPGSSQHTEPSQQQTGAVELEPSTEDGLAAIPDADAPNEETVEPEAEIASESPAEVVAPADEPAVEPEVLVENTKPAIPDAPQPSVLESVATLIAPETGTAPAGVNFSDPPQKNAIPEFASRAEAGKVPMYDPNTPFPATPPELVGILTSAPFPGPEPDAPASTDDIYIASIETSALASDAIALPSVFGLKADPLPTVLEAPGDEPASPDAAADATNDKTLPTQEADDAMAAAVAEALADALAGPAGLIPTKLASAIPDRAPQPRPGGFVEDIERAQFGGRTRGELMAIRPRSRPASAQAAAAEDDFAPPSELAIQASLAPRSRPDNIAALVRAAQVQREAERLSASVNASAPDTSSAVEAALDDEPDRPSQPQRLNIPTTASVARQATIENAIRLNKVNLVGVYGSVSDRRALVRLASGRYVKVKVGDRINGGVVAQINDSELLYRKGNRTHALSMPKG